MCGTVIIYEDDSGSISGSDGNNYRFSGRDWLSIGNPVVGAQIDFTPDNEFQAKNITLMQSVNTHSRAMLSIVCCFLGCLGVHRVATGNINSGFTMFALSCSTPLVMLLQFYGNNVHGIFAIGIIIGAEVY